MCEGEADEVRSWNCCSEVISWRGRAMVGRCFVIWLCCCAGTVVQVVRECIRDVEKRMVKAKRCKGLWCLKFSNCEARWRMTPCPLSD